MQNFTYLVGDRDSGECLVIDPAWDVRGIVEVAEADDMKLVGALATHYHPDHVGGSMFGFTVEGLPMLMEVSPCKVHAHKLEVPGIIKVTGLSDSDLVGHDGETDHRVGETSESSCSHTPGHTPGSSCFWLKSALLAGDTMFSRAEAASTPAATRKRCA